jgi:hypothetical protein
VAPDPGGIKMTALPDAKKSATVAPMPRSRFSSAGRFAGGRAPLKLRRDVGRRE